MRKQVLFGVLAVVLLFGLVGMASADQAIYNLAGNTQTGVVAVSASVNPKITLTIDTPAAGQLVDFGSLDPGAGQAGGTVALQVDSNKTYDLVITEDVAAFGSAGGLMTLNRTLGAGLAGQAKGQGNTHNDVYTVDVPWETEPGIYNASVTYTVTQVP